MDQPKGNFLRIKEKICEWQALETLVNNWRQQELSIVFTNGCFDLLHYGHIHYLAEASNLGDKLIIGQNSAASVRRLKGPHRPINDDMTRQYQLAAMEFIDAVTFFEQDTPQELIKLIMPDVLVKGGDWLPDQIVGADLVLANGGSVLSLPFVEGYSTSLIEQKIRNR